MGSLRQGSTWPSLHADEGPPPGIARRTFSRGWRGFRANSRFPNPARCTSSRTSRRRCCAGAPRSPGSKRVRSAYAAAPPRWRCKSAAVQFRRPRFRSSFLGDGQSGPRSVNPARGAQFLHRTRGAATHSSTSTARPRSWFACIFPSASAAPASGNGVSLGRSPLLAANWRTSWSSLRDPAGEPMT